MIRIPPVLKTHWKAIAASLLVAFVAIQFYRPAKNLSSTPSGHDVTQVFPVPDDVMTILKTSCYDCHSNNTAYPWYDRVQPVASWLASHVNEGKRALNFDELETYPPNRLFKRLEDIQEEVREDGMPLWSYRLVHRNAVLNDAQKRALIGWAAAAEETMKSKYPEQSLKMPSRKRN